MPDGFDFYTGKTIQYRSDKYPHIVRVPNPNASLGVCSPGVGHASENPNDCFAGAMIPCSAFRIQFEPVCGDKKKWGWVEATILEEIVDLDTLFGWKYSEAIKPIRPFDLPQREADSDILKLFSELKLIHNSVHNSVHTSVHTSVHNSVYDSVYTSVQDSVHDSVYTSVRDSIHDSVYASVRDLVNFSVRDLVYFTVYDSVHAYIGSLFSPVITNWKYCNFKYESYPFQPYVDLWKMGIVSSFNGVVWRLHSGPKAEVIYTE